MPQDKLVGYILSPTHPAGRHKSAFFASYGFEADSWQALAAALLQQARENEVAVVEGSQFGMRYTVEGVLAAPDGRRPLVRTVWFMEREEGVPRFVTAYPLKRRA